MARNLRLKVFLVQHRYFLGWMLTCWWLVGCNTQVAKENSNASSDVKASIGTTKETKPIEPAIDTSIDIEALMAARLSKVELDFGWIRLFDGQSMMGWQPSSKANWRIENESLVVDSGEKGFLFTTSRFGDFELQLEFMADESTNSGVFLRSPLKPTAPSQDCYELNIAPMDNPFPTGSLVERIKADSDSVGELEMTEWHTLHALVDGEHIQTWVDGREAVNYQDKAKLTSGYIGLQFREGKIRFRNVRVRPITYSVLPAKSLTDWNVSKSDSFEGTLDENGSLLLKSGPGHLELMQTLENFCAQTRLKTLSSNVNSGVFVRCIPGESLNGYEFQVDHGFNQDRRLPSDSGMGGLFRRQPARSVLSEEEEITHLTILADGPHFASWVEGIQVVDFIDVREANENPRKGLRLEAGTLQLQAHDASCDVRFDSLEISPIQDTSR